MTKFMTGAVVNHKDNGYSWTVEHTDADRLVLCTGFVKDGVLVQMRFHESNLSVEQSPATQNDLVTSYNTSLP